MIASLSCNFIFIRTRKTASTSTEIVLGSWCHPDDIMTPIGVDDELIRYDYGGSPSNFCSDPDLEKHYKAALIARDKTVISKVYKEVMKSLLYHHHMNATEIKSMLPVEFWKSAFKFAVDRHPYEKAISLTYWRKRTEIEKGASIFDFLDEYIDGGEYRNIDLYSIDGKVAVDRVFRYEDLWSEIAGVADKCGKEIPASLPQSKGQFRKDRRPASEVFSEQQKQRIYEVCREEFKLLGYER